MKLARVSQNLLLTTAIFLIAVAYVLTPLLVKSLIDGFVPTQDVNALVFGLAVLIGVEITGLIAAYVFKRQIDRNVAGFVLRARHTLLRRLGLRRQKIAAAELAKSFTATIPSLGHQLARERWQRGRDVLVVLFISVAALSLNYRCALAFLAMLGAHVLLTFFVSRLHALQEYGALRTAETQLIGQWLQRLPRLWDLGRSEAELESVRTQVDRLNAGQLQRDRVRSWVDDLGRGVRTLGVVLALGLCVPDVASGALSTGSIWAILILLYRVNGPLSAISRSVVLEGRNRNELLRLKQALFAPASRKVSPEILPGRLARTFDSALKSPGSVHFNVAPRDIPAFMAAMREWLMRIPADVKFLVLDREIPTAETLPTADICAVADVLAPGQLTQDVAGLESLRASHPQTRFWWIGPVYWIPDTQGTRLYVANPQPEWDPKPSDFTRTLSREQSRDFLERWENWSLEARELARDFRRCARLNTPATIARVSGLPSEALQEVRNKMRLTDHCLILPDGSAILGLMGAGAADLEPALKRLLGETTARSVLSSMDPFYLLQRANRNARWDEQLLAFEQKLVTWCLAPAGASVQFAEAA